METNINTFVISKHKRGFNIKRGNTITLLHGSVDSSFCFNSAFPTNANGVIVKKKKCNASPRSLGWLYGISKSGHRTGKDFWHCDLFSSLN